MRKFTNELNSGVSPGPENNVFADIWQQYRNRWTAITSTGAAENVPGAMRSMESI